MMSLSLALAPRPEPTETIFLDGCDLCDNFWLLRHCLQRSPNLENLTIRLCKIDPKSFHRSGRERKRQVGLSAIPMPEAKIYCNHIQKG
ncbi:hypothetical protein ACP70R_011641 [Stipagrostis hirtigluma subsp. patula]